MEKKYLGDSVYLEEDGNMLLLTTNNGGGDTNRIFLELYVVEELCRRIQEWQNEKP